MKKSELYCKVYNILIKTDTKQNFAHLNNGHFTKKQIEIIKYLIADYYNNYECKYIAAALVDFIVNMSLSEDKNIEIDVDLKDIKTLNELSTKVKPPILD